jgi:predicted amidohydrolase YtcJ
MIFFSRENYEASVRLLHEHNFQILTHAIGDGAIRQALDAYEAVEKADPKGLRPRIEHYEAPDKGDVTRLARLGVIASFQPEMIYPRDEWKGMEGLWQKYVGERFLPTAFAIRSVLNNGGHAAFGTDWPVVDLNPMRGLRNAVLRKSRDGLPAGGWVPEQKITVAEAIKAYTLDSAYAGHRENEQGSITTGKLADMIVVSDNLMEIEPDRIANAKVLLTMVGGKVDTNRLIGSNSRRHRL